MGQESEKEWYYRARGFANVFRFIDNFTAVNDGGKFQWSFKDPDPVTVTYTSEIAPASSKEFLDIQATIEHRFTLKRVRDIIIKYSYKISLYKIFNS